MASTNRDGIDDILARVNLPVADLIQHMREGLPEIETHAMREVAAQLGEEFFYVNDHDSYYEIRTGILRSEKKFLSRVKKRKAKNSDGKWVCVGPYFTSSEHRREVDSLVWRPHEPNGLTHDNCYNIDPGPAYMAKKGDVTYWHRLLDHYFDDSEEGKRLRRIFESWIAYPIKHRGRKLKQAIFILGGPALAKPSSLKRLLACTASRQLQFDRKA
jgi:hypothetical protein